MMKICNKCKKEKDLNEFYRNKRYKDGKCYYCKECHKITQQNCQANNTKKHMNGPSVDKKICSYCKKELPASAFTKYKYLKDGLNIICKKCSGTGQYRKIRIDRVNLKETIIECYMCHQKWNLNGFPPIVNHPNHIYKCRECFAKEQRNKYQNEEWRLTIKEKLSVTHQKRTSMGLCRCGKFPRLKYSKSYCEMCWYKITSNSHFHNVHMWQQLKEMAEKQNFICPYSGRKLIPGLNMVIDHKIPKIIRPDLMRDLSNMHWVDKEMNNIKHRMTHDEFIECLKDLI